jgi:hypothetical protein
LSQLDEGAGQQRLVVDRDLTTRLEDPLRQALRQVLGVRVPHQRVVRDNLVRLVQVHEDGLLSELRSVGGDEVPEVASRCAVRIDDREALVEPLLAPQELMPETHQEAGLPDARAADDRAVQVEIRALVVDLFARLRTSTHD